MESRIFFSILSLILMLQRILFFVCVVQLWTTSDGMAFKWKKIVAFGPMKGVSECVWEMGKSVVRGISWIWKLKLFIRWNFVYGWWENNSKSTTSMGTGGEEGTEEEDVIGSTKEGNSNYSRFLFLQFTLFKFLYYLTWRGREMSWNFYTYELPEFSVFLSCLLI